LTAGSAFHMEAAHGAAASDQRQDGVLEGTMLIRMIDMKGLVTVNGRSRLEKERLWTRLS
jgi:hypothetical protein